MGHASSSTKGIRLRSTCVCKMFFSHRISAFLAKSWYLFWTYRTLSLSRNSLIMLKPSFQACFFSQIDETYVFLCLNIFIAMHIVCIQFVLSLTCNTFLLLEGAVIAFVISVLRDPVFFGWKPKLRTHWPAGGSMATLPRLSRTTSCPQEKVTATWSACELSPAGIAGFDATNTCVHVAEYKLKCFPTRPFSAWKTLVRSFSCCCYSQHMVYLHVTDSLSFEK